MAATTIHDVIQYGEDFTTPVPVEGYPRRRMESGLWSYEEQYLVSTSTVDTYIPAAGSTQPTYGYPLDSVEVDYNPHGGFSNVCTLRITWKQQEVNGSGGSGTGTALSRLTYESNSAITEHRIEDHPAFQSAGAADQALLRERLPSFTVQTVTFSRTERQRKSSWSPSFSDIVGTVGAIEAPNGLSGTTAPYWLHTSRRNSWSKGDRLETTDEWTYDAYQWTGTIFPQTTLAQLLAKAKGRSL